MNYIRKGEHLFSNLKVSTYIYIYDCQVSRTKKQKIVLWGKTPGSSNDNNSENEIIVSKNTNNKLVLKQNSIIILLEFIPNDISNTIQMSCYRQKVTFSM